MDAKSNSILRIRVPIENQLDDPSGCVWCVLAPHQLTIYYRGESVGSWRATTDRARWHEAEELHASSLVMRDVHDAMQVTLRALFLFVRNFNSRGL